AQPLKTGLVSTVFFFFSSRRRHTRCLSDWSSDVCSSDLAGLIGAEAGRSPDRRIEMRGDTRALRQGGRTERRPMRRDDAIWPDRSEERRGGEECRARWGLGEERRIDSVADGTVTIAVSQR